LSIEPTSRQGLRRDPYPAGSVLGPDVVAEAASAFRHGFRGMRPAYSGSTNIHKLEAVERAAKELHYLEYKGQQPWTPVNDTLYSHGMVGYLIPGKRLAEIKAKAAEVARRRGVHPVSWRLGKQSIYLIGFSVDPAHRLLYEVQASGLLTPSRYGMDETPADVTWETPGGQVSYKGDTLGLVAILGFLAYQGYREARMYARMKR